MLRNNCNQRKTTTMALRRSTRSTRGKAPQRYESLSWVPGANNAHTRGRTVDSWVTGECCAVLEPEDQPLTPEEVEWIAAEGPVERASPVFGFDSEEEAQSESESESESEVELESESESEAECEDVTEFCHDGVTYYLGAGGALYDPETEERVGIWDGARVLGLSESMGGEEGGEDECKGGEDEVEDDKGGGTSTIEQLRERAENLRAGMDLFRQATFNEWPGEKPAGASLSAPSSRTSSARGLDWKRLHALKAEAMRAVREAAMRRQRDRGLRAQQDKLAATELQRVIRGARARRVAACEAKRMRKEIEKLLVGCYVRRVKETMRRLRTGGPPTIRPREMLGLLRRSHREEESEEWELACARGRYLARTSESRAEFRQRMDQEPRLVRVAWARYAWDRCPSSLAPRQR